MAFPTIPTAGNGRIIGVNQANATATRTSPNLSGLTRNTGDLLICLIVAYQSNVASGYFSGWTSGWTEFIDLGSSTGMCVGAAYRWADGTESGTVQATQAATVTGHATIFLIAVEGAHASTVPEFTALAQGTSAAADPDSLDPSGWGTEDTLWMAVGGNGEVATGGSWTGTGTPPSNYSLGLDVAGSDVLNGSDGVVAFRQNAVSAEDAGAFTCDLNNARNCAMVVAIRPAPAPIYKTLTPATGTDAAQALIISKPIRKTLTPATGSDQAQALSITHTTNIINRFFDGSNDRIRCAIGGCSLTGAYTIAALVRRENADFAVYAAENVTSGGVNAILLGVAGTTGLVFTNAAGASSFSTSTVPVGEWVLIVVRRAAGSGVTPTFSIYDGSWVHEAGSGAQNNAASQAGGTVRFGEFLGLAYGQESLAVVGEWASELSQAQVETLDDGWGTQAWLDLNPAGLWQFNQAAVTTPVSDLAANGADETSRVETTVLIDGPDDWTYVLSQFRRLTPALSSDAAQALSVIKPINKTLASATGSDAAQPLSVIKPIYKSIAAALGSDAAQILSITKPINKALTPATGSDVAQVLVLSVGGPNFYDLVPAVGSDAAQPLSITQPGGQEINLTPAVSSDAAQVLSITKPIGKILTPAVGSDQAQVLGFTKTIMKNLSPASGLDQAQALGFTKTIFKSIGPATEADFAPPLNITSGGETPTETTLRMLTSIGE